MTVSEIQGIILQLKAEGLGVLITDHNVRETLGSCDRAYILSGGQIIAHGLPQEISQSQVVRETYLGENFKL
jgi:lipopolysaccharide export system ATP-binding protein